MAKISVGRKEFCTTVTSLLTNFNSKLKCLRKRDEIDEPT